MTDIERLRQAMVAAGLDASRVGDAAQVAQALGISRDDALYGLLVVLHALAVTDHERAEERAREAAWAVADRTARETAERVADHVSRRESLISWSIISTIAAMAVLMAAAVAGGAWWIGTQHGEQQALARLGISDRDRAAAHDLAARAPSLVRALAECRGEGAGWMLVRQRNVCTLSLANGHTLFSWEAR